jgi:hypothetical protein
MFLPVQHQTGGTKHNVADLTRAGVCIADSRATIDARLAGFFRAAVPNGIFNVPNLDDLAGTHGSEQQKALSLTP